MQKSRACLTLAAIALLLSGTGAKQTHAAVTATNFVLTPNSIKFDLNGNLQGPVPLLDTTRIFFILTYDFERLWSRVFDEYYLYQQITPSLTVSGEGPALKEHGFKLGVSQTVEYFLLAFKEPLQPHDFFSLTIEVLWPENILNPGLFRGDPEMRWGRNPVHPYNPMDPYDNWLILTSGTPLSIPEPSTVALIGAGAAAALVLAVRRRRNRA